MSLILLIFLLFAFSFPEKAVDPPNLSSDLPVFEVQSEDGKTYRVTWISADLVKSVIDVARKVPSKKTFLVRVLGDPIEVKYINNEYTIQISSQANAPLPGQTLTYKNIESVRAFIISYYTSSKVVIG